MSDLNRYTQESRVICPRLQKVYTCVESAGYALSLSPIKIRLCCDHRIPEIWNRYGTNWIFQWYDEYCRTTPKKDWVRPDPIEIHKIKRPKTELDIIKKKRTNERNYFVKIKFMYKAMSKYLSEGKQWNQEIPIWKIRDVFVDYVRNNGIPSFQITAQGVSKHLISCDVSYRRIFDIEFKKTWSERASKYVLSAIFHEVEGINEDTVDVIPDRSYRLKARTDAQPVIDLQSGKIYGSIRKASREIGVREEWIEWCCRGDVNSIFKVREEKQFKFRFVEFT